MTKYFFKKYDNFKKTDCCQPIEFYELLQLIKYTVEKFNYDNKETHLYCSIYEVDIKYVGYDYDIYHEKFVIRYVDSKGVIHIIGYMVIQNF